MSLAINDLDAVAWMVSDSAVEYPAALAFMEQRAAEIRAGAAPETVWLLEHPPLYTGGTSAKAADLLASGGLPVYPTGRGGQYTYHGPGQRIGYVMLDLARRGGDVRRFVHDLEEWLIATLQRFNVRGERREGRIGIWVDRGPHPLGGRREDKIAALGIRVRRWVTFHGVALNVDCDLSHFKGIVPCGISDDRYGVTSLLDLGITATMAEVDMAMQGAFAEVFGRR
ncbi:MAG: lipoyl(octanoyl) transferase LipB [Alphaproteobacteria bacterium]|nr:lipoyl(octanoyl) transferase LipB [Alphaproteobacteria bacterium]